MRDTVRHCFNQNWLATVLQGHFPCLLRRLPNCPDVVSVDPDGVDSISDSSACDAVSPVLVKGRCRNGEAIVTADEDNGTRARGGNVERCMEITLTGGSLAKEDGRYPRLYAGILQPL